ncbi:MAG: TonB-dependent receptor [Dokdonella sp.]
MKKSANSRFGRFVRIAIPRLPLVTAVHLACFSPVFAQSAADQGRPAAQGTDTPDQATSDQSKVRRLEGLTVTAQKRAENVQDVPMSIDALGNEKLTEMNVANFSDYAKLLPSVSMQNLYLGFTQVYMRGVVSGSNGNHSGPLPSVGMYLDEQPITTIQGALDMNIYDIDRVEALAGPQGSLYGASSESGTIRIITNKPDADAFSASASAEVNTIANGGVGYITQGYVNIPFSPSVALRVVLWDKKDAGYIDNVFGTRTYPSSGITVDNADRTRDNYNFADTKGGRAALKIDLDDNWSITPSIAGQNQHAHGIGAYDPGIGDLEVTHFSPEDFNDKWVQSALTVQGKIGNFDLTYAFAHLNREDSYDQDYSDYSFWYDTLYGYGSYIHDNAGNLIDPGQYIHGADKYRKTSHELRLSSPRENRFRFIVGAFTEQQSHDIFQRYLINNLGADISVTGLPNTLWLTQQERHDDDSALFGELNYDLTDKLTATIGGRYYRTDNSLKGFFGFSTGYSSSLGEAACFSPQPFRGAPCLNLDKDTKDNGSLGKANLSYKINDDAMIYATWSEGFRPGGINRRGTLPPYKADFLTNYEFGWKTEWLDHHLIFNGAVFQENWKDFQFALLGQNGLTEIKNANQARIRGFESNITWAATYNLTLSAGIALYNAVLTENYCGFTDADDNPVTICPSPQAPKGTRLPITAKEKGNITARYTFDMNGFETYFQGALVFEGRRTSDLRLEERSILGDLPGYGSFDLSAGIKKAPWSFDFYVKNAFDRRGELSRYAECAEAVCGAQTYVVPILPRTIGLRVTRDF